eukprot:1317738-Amorphochlora_amoeboformis.AAC.1
MNHTESKGSEPEGLRPQVDGPGSRWERNLFAVPNWKALLPAGTHELGRSAGLRILIAPSRMPLGINRIPVDRTRCNPDPHRVYCRRGVKPAEDTHHAIQVNPLNPPRTK